VIPRYHIVAEREHEIQNPTSEEKLLLLGKRLRLGSESRVREEWLAANPGHPGTDDIRRRNERWKRTYLRHGGEYVGWAIFVGWKPDGAS
jgi:hypothetical protein